MDGKVEVTRRNILFGAMASSLLALAGKYYFFSGLPNQKAADGYRILSVVELRGRTVSQFLEERRTWSDRRKIFNKFNQMQKEGKALSSRYWEQSGQYVEEMIFRSEQDWQELVRFANNNNLVDREAQRRSGVIVKVA